MHAASCRAPPNPKTCLLHQTALLKHGSKRRSPSCTPRFHCRGSVGLGRPQPSRTTAPTLLGCHLAPLTPIRHSFEPIGCRLLSLGRPCSDASLSGLLAARPRGRLLCARSSHQRPNASLFL